MSSKFCSDDENGQIHFSFLYVLLSHDSVTDIHHHFDTTVGKGTPIHSAHWFLAIRIVNDTKGRYARVHASMLTFKTAEDLGLLLHTKNFENFGNSLILFFSEEKPSLSFPSIPTHTSATARKAGTRVSTADSPNSRILRHGFSPNLNYHRFLTIFTTNDEEWSIFNFFRVPKQELRFKKRIETLKSKHVFLLNFDGVVALEWFKISPREKYQQSTLCHTWCLV